ncbi:MAG: prolyl oligopeptidase family serine peptidase [Woeseiaceae bacterium]|nr:prolyl oligopeptidase family serine peptidase [Woeseiaceae bacterium]
MKKLACVLALLCVASCQPQPDSRPKTDTPYAVGSSTRFIHDLSRGYDAVAGVDAGLRILITEVWYPVEHDDVATDRYRRATYGDYVFGDREMHQLMMTNTTFFHLTADTVREGVSAADIETAIDELFVRERLSYVDAPLAKTKDTLPVVVMSHGDAGSRYNMETACEYLAAHGYVVIAPEHTGNSPYSLTGRDPSLDKENGDPELLSRMAAVMPHLNALGAYGSDEKFGQTYVPESNDPDFLRNIDRALLQRVNDLRATLDELQRMNASGPFTGRLDLQRIGLMGRSFGGMTTLAALVLEPRFTAGMAVVPLVLPDMRESVPNEWLRSANEESVVLSANGPFAIGEITKPTLILSGGEDKLIIGVNAAMAAATGTAMPTPDNPHPTLREAYETTRKPVVWGLLRDSNHGSFGVSGPFWWPQLKPDTQERFFEPETTFKLVDSQLAHRIQKEKALQFFDLMIRGDGSARTDLLENQFVEDGFVLETRNLDTTSN